MNSLVYPRIVDKKKGGQKSLALLIDPDKADEKQLEQIIQLAVEAGVDYFLVGGSLVISQGLHNCIEKIKGACEIPVILFPGSPNQVAPTADALLYLSLISGRNADYLIGQHVISAPAIRRSGLELIPTGYMVVDGGAATTVSYISNATPLPYDKPDIALCTAMAGEMLGLKCIYMDAGSGARRAVSEEMISAVSQHIDIPLIVGGGIRDAEKVYLNCKAGADVIVIGNAVEKDPSLIAEMAAAVRESFKVKSKK